MPVGPPRETRKPGHDGAGIPGLGAITRFEKRLPRFNPTPGSAAHQQAAVLDMLGKLDQTLGNLGGLLDELAPSVIQTETLVLDGNGQATRQFRVPFRCLGVDYFGTTTLTVTAAPLAGQAPGPGPGVAKVGPGGFSILNMRAYACSFYGNPGELVTVTAYAKPQPGNGVVNGTTGVLVAAPGNGLQITPMEGVTSVTASGSVTSPSGVQQIAATAALANGLYDVWIQTLLAGTVSATDQNNMEVRNIGSPRPLPIAPVINLPQTFGPFRVAASGGQNVNVASVATATVSAIYSALIIATQVG